MMAFVILGMAGCASIGPTVKVTPGPAKSASDWQGDVRGCMAVTDARLQPIANGMNAVIRSIDRIRADNARIQDMYDNSYGSCMAAHGNVVAVAAPAAAAPQTPPASGASDRPSSDPESRNAERALASTIWETSGNCHGVTITTTDAPLSTSRVARLVVLAQPNGDGCFGQPGQNAYLVAKAGSGWATLLAAEPGSIGILSASHAGYHDVEFRSLGLCIYTYRWTGQAYARAGSHDCPVDDPPTVGGIARKIRDR